MSNLPDYGLWQLVIINSVIFLVFVFSFFKPPLVVVYSRLARREEREAFARFGELYTQYARKVPRFMPRIGWAN